MNLVMGSKKKTEYLKLPLQCNFQWNPICLPIIFDAILDSVVFILSRNLNCIRRRYECCHSLGPQFPCHISCVWFMYEHVRERVFLSPTTPVVVRCSPQHFEAHRRADLGYPVFPLFVLRVVLCIRLLERGAQGLSVTGPLSRGHSLVTARSRLGHGLGHS